MRSYCSGRAAARSRAGISDILWKNWYYTLPAVAGQYRCRGSPLPGSRRSPHAAHMTSHRRRRSRCDAPATLDASPESLASSRPRAEWGELKCCGRGTGADTRHSPSRLSYRSTGSLASTRRIDSDDPSEDRGLRDPAVGAAPVVADKVLVATHRLDEMHVILAAHLAEDNVPFCQGARIRAYLDEFTALDAGLHGVTARPELNDPSLLELRNVVFKSHAANTPSPD